MTIEINITSVAFGDERKLNAVYIVIRKHESNFLNIFLVPTLCVINAIVCF